VDFLHFPLPSKIRSSFIYAIKTHLRFYWFKKNIFPSHPIIIIASIILVHSIHSFPSVACFACFPLAASPFLFWVPSLPPKWQFGHNAPPTKKLRLGPNASNLNR
jgi:hypothetical protein